MPNYKCFQWCNEVVYADKLGEIEKVDCKKCRVLRTMQKTMEDVTQAKWLPSFSHNDKKWKPYFSTNIQHAGRISPLKTVIECDQLIKDCEPQLNILRDFFN